MLELPSGLSISVNRYDDSPPGLPDLCFVISNSERRTAFCDRRYLLAVIEGLKSKTSSAPARYGQLYHKVKETVYKAWMEDRAPTEDEMRSAMSDVKRIIKKEVEQQRLDGEDGISIVSRMESSIEAWLHLHGGGQPTQTYKLIAWEQALAMPVLTGTGRIYKPDMFLVKDGDKWRIARPGEQDKTVKVNWPWYFIGKLDMLFEHRARGGLYVSDDKTTKSPKTLLKKLTNDPQVPSYLALVRYNVDAGNIVGVEPKTPILGFWHRITNSAGFKKPKELQGRKKAEKGLVIGLSKSKQQRCLSWVYRKSLIEHGFDCQEPDYAAMLDHLKRNVDENVEISETSTYSQSELDRFQRELYADVRRISALWRSAARAKNRETLDYTHRRIPVCQAPGGMCRFIGPCMNDGVEVRADYNVKAWQTWKVRTGQTITGDGTGKAESEIIGDGTNSTESTMIWGTAVLKPMKGLTETDEAGSKDAGGKHDNNKPTKESILGW